MTKNHHSPLFRLASGFLKYFLLALVGLAIAWVLSMTFGGSYFVVMLLPLVEDWILRLAIILLCLMVTAIIFESLR
ncbi:MAG: hypothetical protein DSM106950_28710 [Stigonema ocellatum SAG 48.90 = DSM 106950]|nr:hypothetical protein [Stigonema ocellatum SAG 48.90 = DSM 106950]